MVTNSTKHLCWGYSFALTPNSLLPSYKRNRLSYSCIPCTPSIHLYTQYTPAYPVYPSTCTCIDLPDITRYVGIEDLYLALRNVIKLNDASLKSRFSKVQSCLNILNEFEPHHDHTRFTELYVPIGVNNV